ncbi:hypothetical protein EWM64_g5202 [Hericium alpestre]|uniref:Uncharacterized protein n=1 Tax=Hericium alpestre TaxID=135208 RepID=A0A4Y9ZXA8_9AGAM|nr:hypothetical protein EWM64_g5202 [Hericium alpestre]
MLLKFSSSDLLNSRLLTADSLTPIYTICTTRFIGISRYSRGAVLRRRTAIYDAQKHDRALAVIEWAGRVPCRIRIGTEELTDVEDLFDGCSGVDALQKTVSIPARCGGAWTATRGSLKLEDKETGVLKSAFFRNSICFNGRFIAAPLPGLGSDLFVLKSQSVLAEVEIIASFFIMEIIRRNVFNVAPHAFDRHLGPYYPPSESKLRKSKSKRSLGKRTRSSSLSLDFSDIAKKLKFSSL